MKLYTLTLGLALTPLITAFPSSSAELSAREPPSCGSSPFQRPCSAASGLRVPLVFKLPSLLVNGLVLGLTSTYNGLVDAAALPLEDGSALGEFAVPSTPFFSEREVDARDRPSCGSSPFQRPCNAASGLRVPSVFKLPVLVYNALSFSQASAVASRSPNTELALSEREDDRVEARSELEGVQEEKRQTLYCGYSLIDIDCGSAASGLRVPAIFSLPTLFVKSLILASKSLVSALPTDQDSKVESRGHPQYEPHNLWCGPGPDDIHCNAGSNFRVPSIFTLFTSITKTASYIPLTLASAVSAMFDTHGLTQACQWAAGGEYTCNWYNNGGTDVESGNSALAVSGLTSILAATWKQYSTIQDTLVGALSSSVILRKPKTGLGLPAIFVLLKRLASIPMAEASVIPDKKRETLSPTVELSRLSRSINPSLLSLSASSGVENIKEKRQLTGRDIFGRQFPKCDCNENGCHNSPACCANGTCPQFDAGDLVNESSRICQAGWMVGVVAAAVGVASVI